MWAPERILRVLRDRGDLWQAAPGLVGLRGATLALYSAIERAMHALAATESRDEWRVPAGIALETLERADYFTSFPQWLTLASHLREDEPALERVARSSNPSAAARTSVAPAEAALAPAVCYHVYSALAGTVVAVPRVVTAQSTCWRHEGRRVVPLERDAAFTMREIVCVGPAAAVDAFVVRGERRACDLAATLELDVTVSEATDPFFLPTARGRELLQRVKGLKRELRATLAPGRAMAAASFNHHETFFATAFDIRLSDGTPASSGCVAFCLERWTLAFLIAHGPEPASWPSVSEAAATCRERVVA